MPHSENFPGGLWINGVRVDVAGRIAPKRAAQSKDTAEARQPAKQGSAAVDLFAMLYWARPVELLKVFEFGGGRAGKEKF